MLSTMAPGSTVGTLVANMTSVNATEDACTKSYSAFLSGMTSLLLVLLILLTLAGILFIIFVRKLVHRMDVWLIALLIELLLWVLGKMIQEFSSTGLCLLTQNMMFLGLMCSVWTHLGMALEKTLALFSRTPKRTSHRNVCLYLMGVFCLVLLLIIILLITMGPDANLNRGPNMCREGPTKGMHTAVQGLKAGCYLLATDGKTLMKGVELVRKTACKFVQTRCRRVLDLVLADARVKEAASLLSHRPFQESFTQGLPVGFLPVIDILNQAYTDLREGRVPMGELCFSTELSRKLSAYKSTQMPHLAVYQKFVERNEELPQIHDRIQYVFVEPKGGVKGARKTEMAEDPAYAERHGVPVAVDHYFDKLLQGAANILQCLFDNNSGAALSVLQNFTARPPF